jgi:hypothetical protein
MVTDHIETLSYQGSKYLRKNVVLGLVNICIGGFFLTVSGSNLLALSAFDDLLGPPNDAFLTYVTVGAIVGAVVTSIGLFLFLIGLKQAKTRQ